MVGRAPPGGNPLDAVTAREYRDRVRAFLTFALTSSLVACGGDPAPTDGGVTPPDAAADSGATLPPGPRPTKRSDVQGAWDPATSSFVIFGGDDGPIVNQRPMAAFRDDTWLFVAGEGWVEIEGAGPSPRARYATAYGDGQLFLFGGRYRDTGAMGDYTLYADLWAFDFETREWSQLDDGTGPAARYFATAAYDEGSGTLYVAGGGTNANALRPEAPQDLWAWDGATWREIPTSGAAPSSRLFEAWAHDTSRGQLVAFGGQVGDFFSPAFDELFALDLETGAWTQLDAGGAGGPSGRFNAMMAYDPEGDRYLMFGGHADPGVTNDLWAFDPNGGGWSVLSAGDAFTGEPLGCLGNSAEIPQNYVTQDLEAPERRQGGFFDLHDGQIWLFAGESDCSDHLDDIWTYDLATDTWREVLEARSGETCDRRGDDCMCLCL